MPEGYVMRYDIHTGMPYAAKLDPVTGEAVPVAAVPEPQPAPEPSLPDAPPAEDAPPQRFAGFLPRLAAYAVDVLLIALCCGLPRLLLGLLTGSAPLLFTFTAGDILAWVLARAYFVLFTKRFGATPGKMLLRIRVVSADGAPLSWWTVLYRETVGRYLTSLLWVGYVVLAFDGCHRGFHDMLADTRVCLE